MKALITGGAGFIGSHLAEYLLSLGWTVQVIDDLSTGSMKNIKDFKNHPRFSYVIDTVVNRWLMMELVDEADIVFHLAAAVGVRLIVDQPIRTIKTNIDLTEIILEICARQRKPVLITSSSEVYGKLENQKFNEEDNLVLGPTSKARWCYAASKIIDEFMAKAYFLQKELPVVIIRFFNIIGPRQNGQYGMVVPRFIKQAMANQPITVYGDGSQCRSFTWIGDVVKVITGLINMPQAYGEVFNIGHTAEVSIIELARLVKYLTQSESVITFVPYTEAYEPGFEDMARRLPDISKIQQLTGYSPTLTLEEMLTRIIDYERS